MQSIYLDEAGTSNPEPVSIVAGPIIDARKLAKAASSIDKIYDHFVPMSIRSGFTFHAKEIFSGKSFRGLHWPPSDRTTFIGTMAALPRHLHAAICVGKVRRDSRAEPLGEYKYYQIQHMMAFHHCIARADKYIRDWCQPDEPAEVIAEDCPEMRKLLRLTPNIPVFRVPDHGILWTDAEKECGALFQTNSGQIEQIDRTIQFLPKGADSFLCVADACAFCFRRYFSDQPYGDLLLRMMLGRDLIKSDWKGPSSSSTFSFDPSRFYETPPLRTYQSPALRFTL